MEITSEQTREWLKSGDSREYFELVAFPTVGADPSRLRDCVACATWLKKWLKGIGAEAELVLPPQRGVSEEKVAALSVPVVFAELKGTEGAPTLLFYGHYDVQPADPLEQWETPPFEPTPRDGRVYARGAQDDKGQFFAFLCGLREFWREAGAAGRARPNVKILLEGQEESGSTGLFRLLGEPEFRRRIAADVMLVCDTSAASDLRPAIVAGMRGVCHFTVRLEAASRDLHSGEFGGVAPNAAQGMCELLASLQDARGAIAVAGFRDGAVEPTAEELEAATAGAASEAEIAREIGTDPCGGERGVEPVRRGGFDPTIEVNGVHSGYGGPGSKTVIPCEAVAKLSMRLVPGQNPQRCFELVKEHLRARCPGGMRISFPEDSGLSSALKLPLGSPAMHLAEEVLSEMDVRGPVFRWEGASIPVVAALKETSGAAPLLVGWGQSNDRIHSPNESFSVRQFLLAKQWGKSIFSRLA